MGDGKASSKNGLTLVSSCCYSRLEVEQTIKYLNKLLKWLFASSATNELTARDCNIAIAGMFFNLLLQLLEKLSR